MVLQALHWLVSLGVLFVHYVHPLTTYAAHWVAGCACSGEKAWYLSTGEAASPALAFAGNGAVLCFLVSVKSSALKVCGWHMQLHAEVGTLHFPMQLCFFRHYLRDLILTSHTPMLADTGESYSLLMHARPGSVALSWFDRKRRLSSSIPAWLKSSQRFMLLAQHALMLICCWNIYGKEQPSDWGI